MNRRLYYHCHSWAKSWLSLPFQLLESVAMRATVQACHHEIFISSTKDDSTVFVRATIDCLDLIKQTDPRFFVRIQRHVAYIDDSAIYNVALYRPFSRAVIIDFAKYWLPEHRDFSLRAYAMTLVHEATHGYLCARAFPYTKKTRARIEKICDTEANRFLTHLGNEWVKRLHRTFDGDKWKVAWHGSRWEKFKLQLARTKKGFSDD